MTGESDTVSTGETEFQTYKCHICNFKPGLYELIHILEQIDFSGPYQPYVHCEFADCQHYVHVKSIHYNFPNEELNYSHLQSLSESSNHCPACKPGNKILNY